MFTLYNILYQSVPTYVYIVQYSIQKCADVCLHCTSIQIKIEVTTKKPKMSYQNKCKECDSMPEVQITCSGCGVGIPNLCPVHKSIGTPHKCPSSTSTFTSNVKTEVDDKCFIL